MRCARALAAVSDALKADGTLSAPAVKSGERDVRPAAMLVRGEEIGAELLQPHRAIVCSSLFERDLPIRFYGEGLSVARRADQRG